MNPLRHLIFVLAASALLAACTTPKVRITKDADRIDSLPANHGIVVAQVVDASNNEYPINYITLAPKDVYEAEENQFARTEALPNAGVGMKSWSSHYVSVVEAGEYSLSDLRVFYVRGEYIYSSDIGISPAFGTFEVRPGQITNLGTIIYYKKPDGDRYSNVVVRSDSFQAGPELVFSQYPSLAQDLSSEPLSWTPDDYESERFSQYLSVVQNPTGFGSAVAMGDELLLLSKAGVILRRNESGEWNLDIVESDVNLLAFDKNDRGDEVVAGELGTLFFRASGDPDWTSIPPPVPFHTTPGVALGSDGHIYAHVEGNRTITVYRALPGSQPDWEAVMQFDRREGWRAIEEISTSRYSRDAQERPKALIETSYFNLDGRDYFLTDGIVSELDFDALRGEEIKTGFKVLEIGPFTEHLVSKSVGNSWTGKSTVRVASGWDDDWRKMELRLDACPDQEGPSDRNTCAPGQTRRFTNHDLVSSPYFVSEETGYALMKFRRPFSFSADTEEDEPFIAVTYTGGATWISFAPDVEVPKYCTELLPPHRANSLLIACNGTTGRIYEFDLETKRLDLQWEPNAF